jgi:hypothetical protein
MDQSWSGFRLTCKPGEVVGSNPEMAKAKPFGGP